VSDDAPAMFQGTIHGLRTVPTRGVVQVTVECKIEDQAKVAKIAIHGAWVAVALLKSPPEESMKAKGKRTWHELSSAEQAGITANDPVFWKYFGSADEHDAAIRIRKFCGVLSRAELNTQETAKQRWEELHSKFTAWKLAG